MNIFTEPFSYGGYVSRIWAQATGLTAPLIGLGVVVALVSHGSAQAQTSLPDADCARSVAAAHMTVSQAEESGANVSQAETALATIQRECSTAMGLTVMTSIPVSGGAAASQSSSPSTAITASPIPTATAPTTATSSSPTSSSGTSSPAASSSSSGTSSPAASSTRTVSPSPSASATTSSSPTSCSVQQSASSPTVDHTTAATAALNVASHHAMLDDSSLSEGQRAHITCQQQQAQADYRAAATAAPVWDVVYWTNSNKGSTFDWALPPADQIRRMVAAPTNSNPDCSAWGGMATPGAAAASALSAWTTNGGLASDFHIWMRARDGVPPTSDQINQFNTCVAQDCPGCSQTANGGKASGVLCILDAGSTNTCDVLPPAGMDFGIMRGPQMMGTDPGYPFASQRAAATAHFGEMYEPELLGGSCPPDPHTYGSAVASYITGHDNSRGASNAAPTLGGNGADCPLSSASLPAALAAMGSTYYSQFSLWSSGTK